MSATILATRAKRANRWVGSSRCQGSEVLEAPWVPPTMFVGCALIALNLVVTQLNVLLVLLNGKSTSEGIPGPALRAFS